MVVGIAVVTFRIHECHSLKVKRGVVKGLVNQVRNHFNASVAEVGSNDVHQRTQIGVAMAGSDHQVINAKMDKLLNFLEALGLAEMIDSELEIIHL